MDVPAPSLSLFPYRLFFQASEALEFPAAGASNLMRGALGTVLRRGASDNTGTTPLAYSWLFAPVRTGGASGFADPPRPFVLRAATLDGQRIERGEFFHFDLHLFEHREEALPQLVLAFSQLARVGLGPRRARVELRSVELLDETRQPSLTAFANGRIAANSPRPLVLSLSGRIASASRIHVAFATPTELKGDGVLASAPEFGILFARLRDRIAALCNLYGSGPLQIDFRGMGARAAQVRLVDSELEWHARERRSSRTGQTHPLGGFTGTAAYEGDLAEFLPWLSAGYWTGVGRQTVWGKGVINLLQDRQP
jgi:hypothetical protein